MTEIIFSAPDVQSLAAAAAQMGFWDAVNHTVVQTGPIPVGGAWWYNYAGAIPEASGVWGRIRHNGDPAYLPTLPENSGVTLYTYSGSLGGWTSDGVTLAPEWVGSVAVIA